MLIMLLFDLVLELLQLVFSWVSFPAMPSIVTTYINYILGYIETGLSIIYLFFPRNVIVILLPIILILDNFDKLYSILMWILKKIPFLGMK